MSVVDEKAKRILTLIFKTAMNGKHKYGSLNSPEHVAANRKIAEEGIYPAIDPLASSSRILEEDTVGFEHYRVATRVQELLQKYNELKDIIAMLGLDELSEEDKLAVRRARKLQRFLSQPMFVAEKFTGVPGKYVKLEDTIKGFAAICDGECDDLPEAAFYNVGAIEDAFEKAESMKAGE